MTRRNRIQVFSIRAIVIVFLSPSLYAQNKSSRIQSWNDYNLIFPVTNTCSFDVTTRYQTLLSEHGKWRAISIAPRLDYSINPYFSFLFAMPISYTWQSQTINTAEVRLSAGMRVHVTPAKRISTRILVRHEPRFLHQENNNQWQKSSRTRIRGEFIIPVNHASFNANKLWYCLADYEIFLVKNNEIQERFANRHRARVGVGYRFSNKLRLELTYMLQRSRNTLDDPLPTTDHIIRFRLRHFLQGNKPSDTTTN